MVKFSVFVKMNEGRTACWDQVVKYLLLGWKVFVSENLSFLHFLLA